MHHHSVRKSQPAVHIAGFTYVEVLIATLLIVVTLLPAIQALYPATVGAGIHESRLKDHYRLAGGLEALLARPFAELDTEAVAISDPTMASTTYSDPTTEVVRRLVYLSRYDADNADADNNPFTGTEDDLLWIRVEIAGTTEALETLLSAYD